MADAGGGGMKQRQFKLSFTNDGFEYVMQCIVTVTESESAITEIKQMVEFWSGWQKLLKSYGGDYTKTFVRYFANTLEINKNDFYNLEQVKEGFDGLEGFSPIFERDWFAVGGFWNEYEEPELGIEIEDF